MKLDNNTLQVLIAGLEWQINMGVDSMVEEKNNYSDKGDLLRWGDSNLLEWKIHQALQIKNISYCLSR